MVMYLNNYDINTPKLIYPKDILEIGKDSKIEIGLYKKRLNTFYDVIFIYKNKEIFLGRFDKEDYIFQVKYNNGKILIGYSQFQPKTKKVEYVDVLALYEIIDDTFYSCQKDTALNMFDPNIDPTFLKNKKSPIYRSDLEKVMRLNLR